MQTMKVSQHANNYSENINEKPLQLLYFDIMLFFSLPLKIIFHQQKKKTVWVSVLLKDFL